MKNLKLLLLTLLLFFKASCQESSNEYSKLIREAWKLCLDKKFSSSAELYEKAFKLNKNIPLNDRYNASCIYALSGNKEKAFKHLFIIANELQWTDHNHLINDTDLNSLHSDKRWEELNRIIIQNKKEQEKDFDKELVAVLDQIYFDDQSTRDKIRTTEEKYGRNSREIDVLWQDILKRDSVNLIKVEKILQEKGWPDKKSIGERGTTTLFLVIQHSNQKIQEKYLSLIEKAMKEDQLPKRQFAMFYDRLVLNRGEKQVYGTQLAMNNENQKPYVLPLIDPENVDKRRAEMGLNTMQENLNRWNITWDVKAYLKELPKLEAKERELNK